MTVGVFFLSGDFSRCFGCESQQPSLICFRAIADSANDRTCLMHEQATILDFIDQSNIEGGGKVSPILAVKPVHDSFVGSVREISPRPGCST